MLPAASPVDGIHDDLLAEILLRLPPQPSSLPRASAVSKRWHNIACNPGFCRRFRRHHRRNPPLLGFFEENDILTFVPTLDAPNRVPTERFSVICDDRDCYSSCGSRHGLVVIFDEDEEYRRHTHIVVWDPVTGNQHRMENPPEFEEGMIFRGTVLRDAGDVHFRVVMVAGETEGIQDRRALARVYSVETNLWSDLVSMPLPTEASAMRFIQNIPAVLAGDSLYWQLAGSLSGILEFDLEKQSLAVMRVPVHMNSGCFSIIRGEGGGLGFLFMSGFTAQLWKRKTDSDGVALWALGRTIRLDKLLSLNPAEHEHILIRGYAEENNVVLFSTITTLFMVQLHSLQFTFMEHTETTDIECYHPFESVYTAETRMKAPEEFNLSAQYIGWP